MRTSAVQSRDHADAGILDSLEDAVIVLNGETARWCSATEAAEALARKWLGLDGRRDARAALVLKPLGALCSPGLFDDGTSCRNTPVKVAYPDGQSAGAGVSSYRISHATRPAAAVSLSGTSTRQACSRRDVLAEAPRPSARPHLRKWRTKSRTPHAMRIHPRVVRRGSPTRSRRLARIWT